MARNHIATRNTESQQPFISLQDAVAHMIPNPRSFSTNQPLAAGSHRQSLVINDCQTQNRFVSEGQLLHASNDTEVHQSLRRNYTHRHQQYEDINVQRQHHSTEGYERIRNELAENVIISDTDNDLQTDSIENPSNSGKCLKYLHISSHNYSSPLSPPNITPPRTTICTFTTISQLCLHRTYEWSLDDWHAIAEYHHYHQKQQVVTKIGQLHLQNDTSIGQHGSVDTYGIRQNIHILCHQMSESSKRREAASEVHSTRPSTADSEPSATGPIALPRHRENYHRPGSTH
ncbi:hypothetical protein CHS0354_021672 [Potamilus streckersoni]|uniref:Uncharacterized protein n=1 Tax=Potamilus streckersoni TaxID=2493646 RepID=A0AAE0SIG1_9BIVA|nr:hypothetical protein CHS0354_021672 [Potamilus streckersoni]